MDSPLQGIEIVVDTNDREYRIKSNKVYTEGYVTRLEHERDKRIAAAQEEIETLKDILRGERDEKYALEQENARLREGLKKLEWYDWSGPCTGHCCPACDGSKPGDAMIPDETLDGHRPDCWLAALLRRIEEGR